MAQTHPLWALRAVPYSRTTFEGEDIVVTIGLSFSADVVGMVPDEQCADVWGRFKADCFGDELDLALEAVLRERLDIVENGLAAARAEAEAVLRERFETCSKAQPRGGATGARAREG
jgi:hypothetical protein